MKGDINKVSKNGTKGGTSKSAGVASGLSSCETVGSPESLGMVGKGKNQVPKGPAKGGGKGPFKFC